MDSPDLEVLLRHEQAKIRKFEIIFGKWWRHYAVPYELRWTLWAERAHCPYCAKPLGARPSPAEHDSRTAVTAHIDHMDPLTRGGEESIRNAVYACGRCNSAKGNRLFVDWLTHLREPHRTSAREIYSEKHGHAPEAYTAGRRLPRLTLVRLELEFDEAVLRKLYPTPLVKGPPRTL